jgi:hypothetical protein
MRIDRRLTFIGVILIVLSMTMATQYATTKVAYTFGIVHPSNADIRFIGSDNNSDDNIRVLRVTNNASASRYVEIKLGDWFPNSVKNYTAVFAIVNEEHFSVNITYVNMSGTAANYVDVWLHGNRTTEAALEGTSARVKVVGGGVSLQTVDNTAWILGAGNGDPANMNGTSIQTGWDTTAHVRYNQTTTIFARNSTRDWVWVQISLNIPSNAADAASATGSIWFHFEATTH